MARVSAGIGAPDARPKEDSCIIPSSFDMDRDMLDWEQTAAIAWSVNQVLAEQADSDAGRPLPPVRYLDRPLHLSNLRDSAIGWDTVVRRIHGIANAQREQATDSHQDAVALRGRLDVVESHLNDMHEALHRLLRGQERAIDDEAEGSSSGDL